MKVFQFFSGEDKTLKIRLNKVEEDGTVRPFSLQAGSTITIEIPASPMELSVAGVIDNFELAEIHVDLSSSQTSQMKSGDLVIIIQSGLVTRKARLPRAIQKLSA